MESGREPRESKLAGCFLCLVAAVVTFAICIWVGGEFFGFMVRQFQKWGIIDWPGAKPLLGFIVFGSMILPGLFLFWLGVNLFAIFGIRVTDDSEFGE
jgi:hypothetical protein